MSKSTFGWKRAGFAGIAAALVAGGTLVGAGAATAATPGLTAASQTTIAQGGTSIPTADVTYTFGNYNTSSTVVATIPGNVCSTDANAAKAVSFAGTQGPVTATNLDGSANPAAPTFNAVLSSSSTACNARGINDVVTFTTTGTASSTTGTQFKAVLSGIQYTVGSDAPLGPVTINAVGTGGLPNGSVSNAVVGGVTFAYDGFKAVAPNASGVSLGTATVAESAKDSYFVTGAPQPVTLALSDGNFTAGVTPTITTEGTGHTITSKPATNGTNSYTFTVTTTSTNTSAATIKVSGLTAQAPNADVQVNLTSTVGTPGFVKALNVLSFNARVSLGSDRYGTAVQAFRDGGFPYDDGNGNGLVLASGQDYPDAMSSSYVAGQLETGILLTKANSLPSVTRSEIQQSGVDTVYIVGGPAAVSNAVMNEVESLHVFGSAFAPNVNVVRIGGINRYETNQNANTFKSNSSTNTVLLATGLNFPDALALGPVANGELYPLVLTKGSESSLTPQAASQIAAFDPTNVVITGGTSIVSQGVEDALKADGIKVSRIAGGDRQETAALIAQWETTGISTGTTYTKAGLNWSGSSAYLTNGIGTQVAFADALSAGPLAGQDGDAILLTRAPGELGTSLTTYLGNQMVGSGYATDTKVGINDLTALGGFGAITSGLMRAAATAVQKVAVDRSNLG